MAESSVVDKKKKKRSQRGALKKSREVTSP